MSQRAEVIADFLAWLESEDLQIAYVSRTRLCDGQSSNHVPGRRPEDPGYWWWTCKDGRRWNLEFGDLGACVLCNGTGQRKRTTPTLQKPEREPLQIVIDYLTNYINDDADQPTEEP